MSRKLFVVIRDEKTGQLQESEVSIPDALVPAERTKMILDQLAYQTRKFFEWCER